MLLRNYDAITHIALNHCEEAIKSLQTAEELVQNANSSGLKGLIRLSRMYYELLCKRDEPAARQSDQILNQMDEGQLIRSFYPSIALYMKYNHQDEWARRYARLVLNEVASGQVIPAAAIAYADVFSKPHPNLTSRVIHLPL